MRLASKDEFNERPFVAGNQLNFLAKLRKNMDVLSGAWNPTREKDFFIAAQGAASDFCSLYSFPFFDRLPSPYVSSSFVNLISLQNMI